MAVRSIDSQRSNSAVAVGVVAGIIGGILLDLFLVLANHTNIIQVWQFAASGVVGSIAFGAPSFALLGFFVHFLISIVWGVIYAWLSLSTWPFLTRSPIFGGLLYGVVVMIAMTTLLVIRHIGPGGPPDTGMLVKSLIAHTVFFGLPVALYVARASRR
jgi:hypothetical protein